jgi:predicted RNase H-like nuclease (RuvC/YqgF family)
MSDSEAQIWKLFEKLEDMERKLTAVTEQRDEALSDLAFSRDLYRLQTKTLDDVREQRDRLAEALKELRNNESMSLGGAAYEIVEQALQSLTPNEL